MPSPTFALDPAFEPADLLVVGHQLECWGGSPLDAIDRANLRNWINNGAPNN